MSTPINSLITSGATWSTFGTWINRTNEIISRVNDIGTSSEISISGGSINGTSIGVSTPSSGKFTELTVVSSLNFSTATITFANDQLSGNIINGGTATVDYMELSNAPTANNHATSKTYVDTSVELVKNQLIAYSLIFGG